jgi:hypothetical protein
MTDATKTSTVRIDKDLHKALDKIKDDTGVPISEQIRRGMWEWVNEWKKTEEEYPPFRPA